LTSDEVRRFKILSNRFKADEEKKLIILFDSIRSEKFRGNEDQLIRNLYRESSPVTRNRYYRLRNKLLDNLEKSLTFYHFKYKVSIHAYYDIQLSLLFRERGNYELALYFLKKAEKTATENDQFNILEVIFEEYVMLGMKDITLNLDRILEDRRLNEEKLKVHRKNTESLAIIIQQLKKLNFGKGNKNIASFLERTSKRLEKSNEIFHSAEGRIQIFRAVSTMLQQKKAWEQLIEFTENSLDDFLAKNLFTNDNHASRLMMRLWLVNALIKNKDFRGASEQLSTFETEMEMFNRQNYSTYYFHYLNAQINVLKYEGRFAEAGKVAAKALGSSELKGLPQYEVYLLVSLADHYFTIGNFTNCVTELDKIDSISASDLPAPEVMLNVDLFRATALHEAGENKKAALALDSFRKTYKNHLKEDAFRQANSFADIVIRMVKAAASGKRVSMNSAYKSYFEEFGESEPGENSIIFFDLYLQSKAEDLSYSKLIIDKMKRR
jgi:hypothetical protein